MMTPRLGRMVAVRLVALLAPLAAVDCGGAPPSPVELAPGPPAITPAPPQPGTAPPAAAALDAGSPGPPASPVASADAGPAPAPCEGQHHLETPAAGVANDVPFTIAAAQVVGHTTGDFATLHIELGSRAVRFIEKDQSYRGVDIQLMADAPSLTLQPGRYEIPHWEKNGPIWSAMLNVSMSVGLGNNARGELVIDEITPPMGKAPGTVRGKAWVCVDPIDRYPGAQWMGGTFTATIKMVDQLYKTPVPFKVEAGRIVVMRSRKER